MSLELDAALNVFFSYSHRDEELRDALEKHLALLKRQGWIRAWHDRRIGAGREWEGEIDENLETADVVLLLVSPDFIASDYCYDRETGRAMERHENGEARVIPVILRPCDWQQAPFGKLQGLPKDARPVTSWEDRDEAFLDVARRIRAVVESRAPAYPDEATRDLSQALETAYEERAEREANGHATRALDKTIAGLKRELRQDGHLKEGDILNGRFRLQERIGQGGFAEVWKAFDRERRSLVAVKVLHSQYGRDKSRRDRFFRGARQMARLRGHPGIVDVLEEKCRDGGYWFFVMEYVAGRDFRRAVLAGELSLEERLAVVLEVGAALADAHEKGIVHRDVKPANILLGRDGRAKLTDFDLVRAADTTGGTRTSMLGTFLYAAPEAMIDGKQAAEPADVYGLGMTALFAVYGADLPADVLWELSELIESLKVDEACREALRRAVERKVERRWGTVGEFCDALRGSLEPVEIERPRPIRERVHEKDGSVLVYVPGGEYTLGEGDSLRRVELGPFWIGKYPVTNKQYREFLEARRNQRQPRFWNDKNYSDPQQPVVGVSWQEAVAYCQWAGLELPTEAQWEASARGKDHRRYPWGSEEPTENHGNFGHNVGRPTAVGTYPDGAGPHGTLDQAGNVWEWCQDLWESDAYAQRAGEHDPGREDDEQALRVVRGGSWRNPARLLRAAFRSRNQARNRDDNLGFRVCRSVPEHD